MSNVIKYGTNLHIKNMYGNGSYLDSCGAATKCSPTGLYNVSTDSKKDRAGAKTGVWQIISSEGSPSGSQVLFGATVHIKNMYANGSYLDSCGAATKCSPTGLYNVSTDSKKDRAGAKTGLWQIISSTGKSNGEPVKEKDSFHLKNMYGNGSYLDSCGAATKCSPTGLYNVSTDSKKDRAGAKTATWTFVYETEDSDGSIPVRFTNSANEDGVERLNFDTVSSEITCAPVDGQTPQAFLSLAFSVASFQGQSYILIGSKGTRVAASKTGKLAFNRKDLRGWYLEYVDMHIECLTPGFTLPSYGPSTDQSEGSVRSSSGVNLSTGAEINSKGPGAGIGVGLNFGTTYSETLKSFSIQDNSSNDTVKTRYKLSSTNASETWSNPKGGNVPYTGYKDLVRMDAAGQLGGTPLNYLPDTAISNLRLVSLGIFKGPRNFKGIAKFKISLAFRLMKVEKTNNVFQVDIDPKSTNYSFDQIYSVDLNQK